jgi:hypothetical protein
MQQAVSAIQVQMGRRSLDVPLGRAHQLPTMLSLQQHSQRLFAIPHEQRPVFFHEGARVLDENRFSGLLRSSGGTLTIRLQPELLEAHPDATGSWDQSTIVAPRTDYFAVQGVNGSTTLYFDKADFDRRMSEFAREGSLAPGMRVIFPPGYKDEYEYMFRAAGAVVVATNQATALLKRWHKNVAISGGALVGGLAGASVLTAEGAASAAVAEGAVAAVVDGSGVAASEATVSSSSTNIVSVGGAAIAAVAVGYLTFRGLQWLLPELSKEEYTILMNAMSEDPSMLEFERQASIASPTTTHHGTQCSICMEMPQDAAAVPCGHTACHGCLEKIASARSRPTDWSVVGFLRCGGFGGAPCPHCRTPMQGIQRIYF